MPFKEIVCFPFTALLGGCGFPVKLTDNTAMDQFKAAMKSRASYSRLNEVWCMWEEGNYEWLEQRPAIALAQELEIWYSGYLNDVSPDQ